ncbi:MAG: hypothetical protein JWM11_7842, partial [Planctomycetaceae bacterium]|nr:hypothetical protein [Planctomycetaceae bacterium]
LWVTGALAIAGSVHADPPMPRAIPIRLDRELNTPGPRGVAPLDTDANARQVRIEAFGYEVVPALLGKLADKTNSPLAEFLKLNGFRAPNNDTERVAVSCVISDKPLSFELQGQDVTKAFDRLFSPMVRTFSGQEVCVQVRHRPATIPAIYALKHHGLPGSRDAGLEFQVKPTVNPEGLIVVDARIEYGELGEDAGLEINGTKIPSLSTRILSFATKLKSGQYLFVAEGNTESGPTRIIQIRPCLLPMTDAVSQSPKTGDSLVADLAVEKPASVPAPPTQKSVEPIKPAGITDIGREIVVEDRWPIAEIKVGQRVVVAPIWVAKSSLSTSHVALSFAGSEEFVIRVSRIEPVLNQKGRRVSLILSELADKEDDKQLLNWFKEKLPSATTNCVIPAEQVSVLDLRWLDEVYAAIDPELRPQPVQIVVGETFIATGVQGMKVGSDTPTQTFGPFVLEFLNSETVGIWKVTAADTGITRLIEIQHPGDDELSARIRRTEYLVKTDTRELELHLKHQFPAAKVTVTPVGSNAIIIAGTVESDEDSSLISKLAEQFKPQVLNRLKVASVKQAVAEFSVPMGELEKIHANNSSTPTLDQGTVTGHPVSQVNTPVEATGSPKLVTGEAQAGRSLLEPMIVQKGECSERIVRHLETTVSQYVKDEPLRNLMHQLLDRSNIQWHFDKNGLEEADASETVSVTCNIANLKLGSALKTVLNPLKLDYVVDGDLLRITSVRQAALGPNLVVAYPVSDLSRGGDQLEALSELIRDATAPGSWRENDGKIDHNSTMQIIFVRQTQNVHDEIYDFISLLRLAKQSESGINSEVAISKRTEAGQRIQRQLKKTIDLDLPQGILGDALDQLRRAGDIRIDIDSSTVGDEVQALKRPVSIGLKGVQLETALKHLLEPLNQGFVIEGGAVKITTDVAAATHVRLAVYSVSDLRKSATTAEFELESLKGLIQKMVSPHSWVHEPTILCHLPEFAVVVRQTSANHTRIREFINRLRKLNANEKN